MSKKSSDDNIAAPPTKTLKVGAKKVSSADADEPISKKGHRTVLTSQQLAQLAKWYETTGSYAKTAVLAKENGIQISAPSISNKLKERQRYLDSVI